MFSEVVPKSVKTACLDADDPLALLLPEEMAALGRVGEVRRKEFTTGRSCARRALAELGVGAAPILAGANREPLWPEGAVGSITHCRGYRAAATASRKDFLSIGIDAERNEPLPDRVIKRIAREEERAWLPLLPGGENCWDTLLFSAKESIYKAWFPIARRWLGFEDALVWMDPEKGTFRVHLVTRAEPCFNKIEGRFLIKNGLVMTFVGIAPEAGTHT